MLAKVNDVEERLSKYLGNLTKAVDDVRAGKENVKMPTLDTDAVGLAIVDMTQRIFLAA